MRSPRLHRRAALALTLPGLLAACGRLPQPFAGNPGATARRLSQPPPARLAVVSPGAAMLPDAAGATLAQDLAIALQGQEVPAVAEAPKKGDWRLVTSAELRGDTVLPVFTVQNPAGEDQGAAQGVALPASDWAKADPAMLGRVAEAVAPNIASLLTRIEAARRESDPNSLVNRPARVFFKGVTGAPGDGDQALTRQMRSKLPGYGPVVQDTDSGADFVLTGRVSAVPAPGGQQRVEIQWRVSDPQDREVGKVVQLNDVPAGTLDHYWGDVAVVVAEQAAGGIRDVILNNVGARRPGA